MPNSASARNHLSTPVTSIMSTESAPSPFPVALSSPRAARPVTPSVAEARVLHRSSKSAVSRSAELGSIHFSHPNSSKSRTERLVSSIDLGGFPDLEPLVCPPRYSSSSGASGSVSSNGGLVPQPPLVRSPAVSSTSPRLRSFSSRALPSVRASLSISQLPGIGEVDAAAELHLAQLPRQGNVTVGPLTAAAAAATDAAAATPPRRPTSSGATAAQPSSGTRPSPVAPPAPGTPHGGAAAAVRQLSLIDGNDTAPITTIATTVAAGAPFVSSSTPGPVPIGTDTWVALRAQDCMVAYGSSLSSDGDDDDNDSNGGRDVVNGGSDGGGEPSHRFRRTGTGLGRLVLVRHPSLVGTRRDLTRSYDGDTATVTVLRPQTSAVQDVAAPAPPSPRQGAPGNQNARATIAASVTTAVTVKDAAATSGSFVTPRVAVPAVGPSSSPAALPPCSETAAASIPNSSGAAVASIAVTAAAGPFDVAPPGCSSELAAPRMAVAGPRLGATPSTDGASTYRGIGGTADAVTASGATGATISESMSDLSGPAIARARMAAVAGATKPSGATGECTEPAPVSYRSESGTSSIASAAGMLEPAPCGKQGRGSGAGAASTASAVAGIGNASPHDSPFASMDAFVVACAPSSATQLQQQQLQQPQLQPSCGAAGGRAISRPQEAAQGAVPGTATAGPEDPSAAEGLGQGSVDSGSARPSLEAELAQQLLPLLPGPVDSDGAGSGTKGRRVSESCSLVFASRSILDVAALNVDPVRKRRLSADGLNRHASKYGTSAAAGQDGTGRGGGSSGAGSPADTATAATPGFAPPDEPPGVERPAAVTPASPSASSNASSSPSGGSGRVPLINALRFERAPWSQPASAAAAAAAAGHASGAPLAPSTPRIATHASMKLHKSPVSPTMAATTASVRMPGWPLSTAPPQRPQLNLGLVPGVSSPGDRIGDMPWPAVATVTTVDKLRGFKSSRVLIKTPTWATSSATAVSPQGSSDTGATTAAPDSASASTTTTGRGAAVAMMGAGPTLSSRTKLGSFMSMRSPRSPASFLERLSSTAVGTTTRVSSRHTIGGGGAASAAAAAAGDWAPESSSRRLSFRRRDGSCSLDGSGCNVRVVDTRTSPLLQRGAEGNHFVPGGGGTAARAAAAPAVAAAAAAAGYPDWSALPGGAASALVTAPTALAGLPGKRSSKQLLPRGLNGVPLAWLAIAEDGREGSDGGREEPGLAGGGDNTGKAGGGTGKADGNNGADSTANGVEIVGDLIPMDREADENEDGSERRVGECNDTISAANDDEEDGFNLSRAGTWIDLHQTC